MPINERIPNIPLNGAEIVEYVISLLRKRLEADCHFTSQINYSKIAFEIKAQFHLAYPVGEITVKTFEAPTPPLQLEEGQESDVLAFEQHVEVDNPNLVRVATGLPVTVTRKASPKPGEIFPRIERHEVKYSPEDYPEPKEPIETDLSEQTVKDWKVNPRLRKKVKI